MPESALYLFLLLPCKCQRDICLSFSDIYMDK